MSDNSFLDFEALLAPISSEQPCGTFRETSENNDLNMAFAEIRDLLTTARKIEAKRVELETFSPEERQRFLVDYEGKSDGPQADPRWERIAQLSINILCQHSKDTRVLQFLTEAAPRLDGLAGLRDAMKLSRLMLDQYKLTLYPSPESEDEADTCVRMLAKMEDSANIHSAIEHSPFFPDSPNLHWFSHTNALSFEKRSEEERNQLIQEGVVCLDDFNKEIQRADFESLKASEALIADTVAEAQQLDQYMTNLSDRKNPVGITQIIERLKKIQTWYKSLIEDRVDAQPSESEMSSAEQGDVPTGAVGAKTTGSVVVGSIATREQAFANLLQVATFFRKTEPHSPVSYALEQAVRWGKMPLPELLRDLVNDSSVLGDMFKRMGIQEDAYNS